VGLFHVRAPSVHTGTGNTPGNRLIRSAPSANYRFDRYAVPYRAFCSGETIHVRLAPRAAVMSVTLCVLLWAQPGAGDALIAYEDRVLNLVSGHGGRVLQRARSNGADGRPLEIQLLEFPSTAALDDYMTDGRRLSLSDERDRAIARTQVIGVELIQSAERGSDG
jgi:uncharacterized protein (DUF1330 family)